MLNTAIAYTAEKEVAAAARDLHEQIESGMNGARNRRAHPLRLS